MKKFIKVAALVVGLLLMILLVGYFVLWIRQSNSNKQLVHPNSESFVRIKVDQIMVGMLRNALFHPGEYWKGRSDTTQRLQVWEAGVAIPANLYLFSLPEDTLTWYTVLDVTDRAKFQRYLGLESVPEIESTEDFRWYGTSRQGHIAAMGDDKRVMLALSLRRGDHKSRLRELLVSSSALVPIGSLDFPRLHQSDASVTYWDSKHDNSCYLDLKPGEIDVRGNFSSELWRLSDTPLSRPIPKDHILNVSLSADIRAALVRHKAVFSRLHLDIESLQAYIGDYWEVQVLEGSIVQQDTVVTYDYDDNFDLTEKKEIRSETVPNLRFSLKASPHLLSYLPEKAFYRFHKHVESGIVTLATDPAALNRSSASTETCGGCHFFLSFRKGSGDHLLFDYLPRLALLDSAKIVGRRQDEAHRLGFEGKLHFENKYIHPLKQLSGP